MKKNNNTDFNINNVGQTVELYGWVAKKRNLGGLVFIDLRDRSGIIQLVVRPEEKDYEVASSLKSESVIKAIGTIVERESKNISDQVNKLLEIMEVGIPYSANDLIMKLGIKTKETLRSSYLNPAIENHLVVMTLPDKPNSKNQKYIKL